MTVLSTWFPDLRLIAPTAPVPLLERSVREAARAFCQRTYVWQAWLAPMPVSAAPSTYHFALPRQAELLRVQRATLDDQPLAVVRTLDLARDPIQASHAGSAALVALENSTFTLRAPRAGALQVQVALAPARTAQSLPDVLAGQWFEAIADGAKARLLTMPGVDWVNPEQAAYAQAQFDGAVAAAISTVWRSGVAGGKRSKTEWL